MTDTELETAVAARFTAINGQHPMTPEDDAYADQWYAPLDRLAYGAGADAGELRRLMLANRLPVPSYIRSDGTQMVARDLLALADRAGGIVRLPAWFASQFPDPATAISEWDAYLAGRYVCLRSVTPENIKRKGELVEAIEQALADVQPESQEWHARLHRLIDELDALEPRSPPTTGPASAAQCPATA